MIGDVFLKKILSKLTKALCFCLSAAVGIIGFAGIYEQANIPDKIYIPQGNEISIKSVFPLKTDNIGAKLPTDLVSKSGNFLNMNLMTFANTKVKDVNVEIVERKLLIPSGKPFGIKMFTDGVVVVGMSNIYTKDGMVNPAKDAGLKTGDIITAINGQKILLNEQVEKVISNNGNKPVHIDFIRNGEKNSLNISPALSHDDNSYKIGIWVRDSSAGIGTLTYINPDDNTFGGLGHGVCDIDTEQIMPLYSGEIADVVITGVKKGTAGSPGELKGMFLSQNNCGNVKQNCETGVYGEISKKFTQNSALPIAFNNEIHTGKAKILTTVSGSEPNEYDVIIEKVSNSNSTKNMIVKVTDPELLEKSGGIVQGMSGSPIIQDGKLIGAVTHVFVNDPTRGYGIFIENMLNSQNEDKSDKTAA